MSKMEKTREELLEEVRELREKTLTFRREVVDKMSALATAAFGLVAALAWNNAIQALFKRWAPTEATIWPLVLYAMLITVVAVVVTLLIGRMAGRLKAAAERVEKAEKDARAEARGPT